MKIILALIEAMIVIFSIFNIVQIIGNSIDYYHKEVKDNNIKDLFIMIILLGILIGLKYYLEVINL